MADKDSLQFMREVYSNLLSFQDMINRDERRWKAADKNEDGKLDKAEFSNFLHPEEADHMRDIVVQVFKIDGYHSNRNIFKSIRDTCLN
jgi:hypothetical protein